MKETLDTITSLQQGSVEGSSKRGMPKENGRKDNVKGCTKMEINDILLEVDKFRKMCEGEYVLFTSKIRD